MSLPSPSVKKWLKKLLRSAMHRSRNVLLHHWALRSRKKHGVRPDCVLAFFGRDFRDLTRSERIRNGDSFWHFLAKGYVLLPLDPAAMSIAMDLRVDFLYKDDLVAEQDRLDHAEKAYGVLDAWKGHAGDAALVGGLNWLTADTDSIMWTLFSALYSEQLALALQKQGCSSLVYLTHNPYMRSGYNEPDDIHACIWQAILGSAAEPITIPYQEQQAAHLPESLQNVELPQNCALLAVVGEELYRFLPFVRLMQANFPNRTGVCSFGDIRTTRNLQAKFPELPICGLAVTDEALAVDAFQPLYQKSYEFFKQIFPQWGKDLAPFLAYYALRRWPKLQSHYAAWLALLDKSSVGIVIGSQLYDCESQLPLLAGLKRNLPVYTLPHAFMFSPRRWSTALSGVTILTMHPQQKRWNDAMHPGGKTVYLDGLAMPNEYEVQKKTIRRVDKKYNVVVFLIPTSLNNYILPLVSEKIGVRTIHKLIEHHSRFEKHIDLKFKLHPGYPNNIFSSDALYRKYVFPVSSPVEDVLASTDIVIMPNYLGAPMVYSMQADIPVILLDTMFNGYKLFFPLYEMNDVSDSALILNKTVNDAWTLLLDVMSDADKRQEILNNQRQYLATNFSDKGKKDIKDVFHSLRTNN